MINEVFLSLIKGLNENTLTLLDLIVALQKLKAAGQDELVIQLYKFWIDRNPEDPRIFAAYFNYAVEQSAAGDLAGAKASLERALAINPDFFPAYINYSGVLERLGLVDEAIAQWSLMLGKLSAITGPGIEYKTTALQQLSRVYELIGPPERAEATMRESLEFNQNQPDIIQHFIATRLVQCEWPVVSGWNNVERKTLMKWMSPLSMSVYTDDPILQLASGWNYNRNFIGYAEQDFQPHHRAAQLRARTGRRRIGYVSSDLRNHAVGYILAEVLGLHNREEFEIYIYYCGPKSVDALQTRIRNSVEHWVDIAGMTDEAAARKIMADGIEILVDVNGYTKDAQIKLFAMRPAPVIVNWLGFPGSTGSPYHHYIIADDWIIPEQNEIYYSEQVMRLPCYQPNDRKRVVSPERPSRADAGLPEDATVFCCFNSMHKITRFTFERWLTILERVPGSVLWLLSDIESTHRRLRDHAAQRGIAPERLIFAPRMANAYHLARYLLADLFLDTSPYGAHVTASDSLWMGVPVLTLSGRGFASRVCGSLTRAAGLPEMVCATPEEYVERAVELGNDREKIRALKERLEANRNSCTLFNMDLLIRSLENLYREMWTNFCEGRLPRPDLTNLDVYLDIGCSEDHEAAEMLTVKDYAGWYKTRLARRHNYCFIGPDKRLWTGADSVGKASDAGDSGDIDEAGSAIVTPIRSAGGIR